MQDYLVNEQYFQALIEASIVSKSNTAGTIIFVNDNFCNISGYTKEEMLGKKHNMFKHPNTKAAVYKEMWNTISKGSVWRGKMTNLNKDGSNFVAESTIIPLKDAHGKVIEYLAIRNDITDIVNLKKNVALKEQEILQNEKVKASQKSFLLLFTHELKTPLNSIINFNKYIKTKLENPKKIDRKKLINLLDSVLVNADDMLNHITRILDISKLKSGKLNYNFSLFSMSDFIVALIDKNDSQIKASHIKLILDVSDDIFVYSDFYRVNQIVSNVLSNAIRYGKDTISITLASKKEGVALSIEDNGEGIVDKKAVFNLYEQENENLLNHSKDSSGIGLYFLKLLCDDLKIAYKIEDAVTSSGTIFTLIFSEKKRGK
jgi:PAS domain S-box-containing protein